MPTFDVEVDFDVYCSCGAALCGQSDVTNYRRNASARMLTISPCESCLSKAKDEGYDEGYDKAKQEDGDA